ncbi:MAG: OmpA family protein [Bacteroidota bacterium]
MKKRYTKIVSCLLAVASFTNLTAQIYQVQLAAFPEEIAPSFFDYTGFETVYADQDHHNFIRYKLGDFHTKEMALAVQETVQRQGYANAIIHELAPSQYAYVEDAYQLPRRQVIKEEPLYIRSVEFGESAMYLSTELVALLEESLVVMKQNPDLKLRIVGHTNDRGTPSKNGTIVNKRARMIQNFLLANDIPAYRLKMNVRAEPSPQVHFDGKRKRSVKDANQRITLALVDLKEEIVIDNFHAIKENTQSLASKQRLVTD